MNKENSTKKTMQMEESNSSSSSSNNKKKYKKKKTKRSSRKKDINRIPGINVTIPGTEPVAETAVLAENTFYFQQRRGRLDLRSISRIDIERVIEDVDIDTLQSHLEAVAFADLDADDLAHYADEHFIKLFRLSQLIIEYLLNVQNALLTYAKDAEEETGKIEAACREGERRLRSRKKKMDILKKEVKQNRKVITTYEALLTQKSAQQNINISSNNNNMYHDIVDLGGKKYVAVDHIKRQMKEEALKENEDATYQMKMKLQEEEKNKLLAKEQLAREKEEEERRRKEELQRLRLEQDTKLKETLRLEEMEIRKELEQERLKREEAEKKVDSAIKATEESVNKRQKEMEEKFREELRRMKEMMEQEIAEQRILAQRQMAQTEGKGSDVPQPSMAGDLEDDEDGNDDDDLLHDRESWGRMRKSRKELEDLCNELQDSLRKKDEALNELKKDADQAAQKMLKEQEDSKEKLEEERLKVEKLAKTMQQKEQKAEEVIQELMSSRAQNIAASKEEVEEEEVEEKVEIEQAKQDAKEEEEEEEIEYKIFYPFYEWKTLKKNEKAYREDECDVQGEAGSKENPKKVRIPTTWTLNLKLEGGNDGANSNVSMKVRKETTTRQVLEDAAAQLGMGPTFWQSLCLMYRHEDESGIHQANAGEKVDNTWTVEKANLFNRRPRLCKFTGISDEDINRLIEKLLAHKKSRKEQNEPDFDPDVEDKMEYFEDIVNDKMKEEIALANTPGRRVLKKHSNFQMEFDIMGTTTKFESIVAQYNHREGEIKAKMDEIENGQLVKMLIYNDFCDEDEKEVFKELDKNDYDEEMGTSWSLNKKVYKKTPITEVKKEFDNNVKEDYKKVSEQRKKQMEMEWQTLDSKIQNRRENHDLMLTAAVQQMRKHHKPMSKTARKKGIKNLFSRMHSYYFGKLLKPDIISKMDIRNEQNSNNQKKKKKKMFGGLNFMKSKQSKSSGDNAGKTKKSKENESTTDTSHKMKKKKDAVEFSDASSEEEEEEEITDDGDDLLSSETDDDDDDNDEDVAVSSNDKKPPAELPKGSDENVVALNDSLRRDLDSTMEDSDIVEFGTLEIDKAADQYEETFKPSAEHLKRSLDLAREAEQEMLRRQVGGEVVGKSPGNRRGRSVPMDDNDDIDINTIENDDDNNNNNEEEEEEISDWDDDDSMEEDNEEALNTTGNKVI